MFKRKKRWFLVPIVFGLLTVGISSGVALAHGGGGDGGTALSSFSTRVAAILGLEESKVQDAFTQASEEARDEWQAAKLARFQAKLDQAVEDGSITQEQADQYMEWLQARPGGFRGFRGHGFLAEHGFGGKIFGSRSFGRGLFSQNRGGGGGESRFFQQAPQDLFSGIDQTITY